MLEAVAGYVKTKRPEYLEALWPLVRDARPQAFGPPDMACLIEHAPRAAEYMETHSPTTGLVLLEDNEPRATMAEVQAALNATAANLAEQKKADAATKADATPSKPRPFSNLDNVRWNAKVELSPEFYDEKRWKTFDGWTEDEKAAFWADYSARYRGKR